VKCLVLIVACQMLIKRQTFPALLSPSHTDDLSDNTRGEMSGRYRSRHTVNVQCTVETLELLRFGTDLDN